MSKLLKEVSGLTPLEDNLIRLAINFYSDVDDCHPVGRDGAMDDVEVKIILDRLAYLRPYLRTSMFDLCNRAINKLRPSNPTK